MTRVCLLFVIAMTYTGCAFKAGPGETGWLGWDVCGWEGGVQVGVDVMGNTLTVGCENEATEEPE